MSFRDRFNESVKNTLNSLINPVGTIATAKINLRRVGATIGFLIPHIGLYSFLRALELDHDTAYNVTLLNQINPAFYVPQAYAVGRGYEIGSYFDRKILFDSTERTISDALTRTREK